MDYSTTKIYKIESHLGNKIYIGSTKIKYLSQRMQQHINIYNRWKSEKSTGGKITSFELFDEYGTENCQIVLIENYPCTSKDAKNAREGHFIKTMACVNKRIEGRNKAEYYKDNKQKICNNQLIYRGEHKQEAKKYYEDHKEELLEYHKKYYEEHKDQLIQYQKEYNMNNTGYTEKIKEYQKTYRAKRRAQNKLKQKPTTHETIIEPIIERREGGTDEGRTPIIEVEAPIQERRTDEGRTPIIENISQPLSKALFMQVMELILHTIINNTKEDVKQTISPKKQPALKFKI